MQNYRKNGRVHRFNGCSFSSDDKLLRIGCMKYEKLFVPHEVRHVEMHKIQRIISF